MAHPKKRTARIAWSTPVLVVGFVAAALAVACTKKDDESKPSAIPASPMAGKPSSEPSPSPAPPPAAPAPAMPPPAADEPTDPKATIEGTVILPAARRADVAPTDTIFLVARRIPDNPTARGTLVAVKKLSAASFPIKFTVSARDMMVPTGGFDGEVSLSVRVDKDGDPMTRRKGDVFGGVPKVSVGTHGVKVVLDQVQKEDESLMGPGPMAPPSGAMPPGHPPSGGMPPGHP